ncbi:hypothetical protein PLICRDRAFT_48538 [Plicaturopsis crispa FD-325 SS-3]|nr:hypothetical protein PLICRDRAFT_48538 [Plicaturopsis crispa FD-325 SS-3]
MLILMPFTSYSISRSGPFENFVLQANTPQPASVHRNPLWSLWNNQMECLSRSRYRC